MDIRSDSANVKEREKSVLVDNMLMRSWAQKAIETGRCVALSMKFRFTRIMKSWKFGFKAFIVFQPYVGSNSTETRLFWWRDRHYVGREMVSNSSYRKKVKSWNILRYNSPKVEKEQQRGIAELVIRLGDFMNEDGTFVSLFAASNEMNYVAGHNILMEKLRTKRYIAMFPEANVSRYWGERLGIHFRDGWMIDGEFVDRLTPGFVRGYNTFDCNTLVWYLRDKFNIRGYPYDSAGMLTQLWFFETNIVDNPLRFQDLINNQTHHVKYFTAALREILNHDNETLHALRREILAFDGVEPIDSCRS